MATIIENIQTLQSIKSDIKDAILSKGGSVGNDFTTYAQAITDLPSGGGGTEIEDALVMRTISEYYNDRVSMVGAYAFYGYSSLASINLPNCTYVGICAFASCKSLTYINLPLCTSIGIEVFSNCTSLTSVNFPKCKYINDYTFSNCTSLTSVNFPLCTSVGFYGFYNCTSLTSINLPNCTYVSAAAFRQCTSLTSVNFPLCTSVGVYAFDKCSNLRYIYLNRVKIVTRIWDNIFSGCTNLTSVYVPSSLVDAFKVASYWSSIADKIVAYTEG